MGPPQLSSCSPQSVSSVDSWKWKYWERPNDALSSQYIRLRTEHWRSLHGNRLRLKPLNLDFTVYIAWCKVRTFLRGKQITISHVTSHSTWNMQSISHPEVKPLLPTLSVKQSRLPWLLHCTWCHSRSSDKTEQDYAACITASCLHPRVEEKWLP